MPPHVPAISPGGAVMAAVWLLIQDLGLGVLVAPLRFVDDCQALYLANWVVSGLTPLEQSWPRSLGDI